MNIQPSLLPAFLASTRINEHWRGREIHGCSVHFVA
jgi:folate-dependent phosphoribosylglycinamide formyltransferase PurN